MVYGIYPIKNGKNWLNNVAELLNDEKYNLNVLNRSDFLKIKRKIYMNAVKKRTKTFKIYIIVDLNAWKNNNWDQKVKIQNR
jgi:hypothetical protein